MEEILIRIDNVESVWEYNDATFIRMLNNALWVCPLKDNFNIRIIDKIRLCTTPFIILPLSHTIDSIDFNVRKRRKKRTRRTTQNITHLENDLNNENQTNE